MDITNSVIAPTSLMTRAISTNCFLGWVLSEIVPRRVGALKNYIPAAVAAASVVEEAEEEDYVEVMEYVEAAEEEGSAEVEVVDAALE